MESSSRGDSRQRRAGEARQGGEKLVLERRVEGRRVRLRRRWWYQYPPLVRASGSSLVASHSCVRCPSRRSSGAPGPPILVGTQPGSTALLYTCGQSRATATARVVTNSLLSE